MKIPSKISPKGRKLRHLRRSRYHKLGYSNTISVADKVNYIIPSNTGTDLGGITHVKPFNYALHFPGAKLCPQHFVSLSNNQTRIIENATEAFLYEEIKAVYGAAMKGGFHQLELYVIKPYNSSSGYNGNVSNIIYHDVAEGEATFNFTGVAHFKFSPPPTSSALEPIVQRALKFRLDYLLNKINENAQLMGEIKLCQDENVIEDRFVSTELFFESKPSKDYIEASNGRPDIMKDLQPKFPMGSFDGNKNHMDMGSSITNSDFTARVSEKQPKRSDSEDEHELKMLAIIFGCLALGVMNAICVASFCLRRYKKCSMNQSRGIDHDSLHAKNNLTIDQNTSSEMKCDEGDELTHVSSENHIHDFDDCESFESDDVAKFDILETGDDYDSTSILNSVPHREEQPFDATRENICAKYNISNSHLNGNELHGLEYIT